MFELRPLTTYFQCHSWFVLQLPRYQELSSCDGGKKTLEEAGQV
jgi:hypothetical protein